MKNLFFFVCSLMVCGLCKNVQCSEPFRGNPNTYFPQGNGVQGTFQQNIYNYNFPNTYSIQGNIGQGISQQNLYNNTYINPYFQQSKGTFQQNLYGYTPPSNVNKNHVRTNKIWTREEESYFLKLYMEGCSPNEIRQIMGKSWHSINYRVKKLQKESRTQDNNQSPFNQQNDNQVNTQSQLPPSNNDDNPFEGCSFFWNMDNENINF